MLKEITRERAFNLLMNEKTAKSVYFKELDRGYYRAYDYKWIFAHEEISPMTKTNFVKADFYEES